MLSSHLENAGRLTINAIHRSAEINEWLTQFPADSKLTATSLLLRLRFIKRDDYSDWLNERLTSRLTTEPIGLFAVRKLDESNQVFWAEDGTVTHRPGTSLGSEDFVYSVISACSRRSTLFLDHPSTADLAKKRVRDLVLIDDSVGSGQRVAQFINSMLDDKRLMSWWSFGWIRFHILALARTYEGQKWVVSNVRGSDHSVRKHRKAEKISFESQLVYGTTHFDARWGVGYQKILDLVDFQTKLPAMIQRGFGQVMSNLIFHHSVPDNTPGILWSDAGGWRPLFGNRALPMWIFPLLTGKEVLATDQTEAWTHTTPNEDVVRLLRLIKLGVRTNSGLALRLNCDSELASDL